MFQKFMGSQIEALFPSEFCSEYLILHLPYIWYIWIFDALPLTILSKHPILTYLILNKVEPIQYQEQPIWLTFIEIKKKPFDNFFMLGPIVKILQTQLINISADIIPK